MGVSTLRFSYKLSQFTLLPALVKPYSKMQLPFLPASYLNICL